MEPEDPLFRVDGGYLSRESSVFSLGMSGSWKMLSVSRIVAPYSGACLWCLPSDCSLDRRWIFYHPDVVGSDPACVAISNR